MSWSSTSALAAKQGGLFLRTADGQVDPLFSNVVGLWNMTNGPGLVPVDESPLALPYGQATAVNFLTSSVGPFGPYQENSTYAGVAIAPRMTSPSSVLLARGAANQWLTLEGWVSINPINSINKYNLARFVSDDIPDFVWPFLTLVGGVVGCGFDVQGATPYTDTPPIAAGAWVHYVLELGPVFAIMAFDGTRLGGVAFNLGASAHGTLQVGLSSFGDVVANAGVRFGPQRVTRGVTRYGLNVNAVYTVPSTYFPTQGP